MRNILRSLLEAAVLCATITIAYSQSPSLVWLTPFPGAPENPMLGGNWSRAHDIAPDGSYAVGRAYFGGLESAFFASMWHSSGSNPISLGTLEICDEPPLLNWSWAYGISADGSVVVGVSGCPGAWGLHYAFRWIGGSMQNLGTLGGELSWAHDVSADGSVVVGWANNPRGEMRAFVWTPSEGMRDLGTLGGQHSMATGVSSDGQRIVGWAETSDGKTRAALWINGVIRDLGTFPGGENSWAYGISSDGSVVVGASEVEGGMIRAFRWTLSGGMQDLGTLSGGLYSRAFAVSADGSVVVGEAEEYRSGRLVAFRWTPLAGMENLNSTYQHLLPDSLSYMQTAVSITPDGQYIVGWGYNFSATNGAAREMGYRLDTGTTSCPLRPVGDVNCDGCVDDSDLLAVSFQLGCCGNCTADVNGDGCVDDSDLLIVSFNLGTGC